MKKTVSCFEDLDVWQDSMRLAVDVIKAIERCPSHRLIDQINGSAISVPSNIAEGFERQSNKEYIRFLYISKGSAGELRTQIYLAIRLKWIPLAIGQEFVKTSKKISKQLGSLIKARQFFNK